MIARVHSFLHEHATALAYYEKATILNEKTGDEHRTAVVYNGLASIYEGKEDFTNAVLYGEKALALFIKTGNKYSTGVAYGNIGRDYAAQSNYEKTLAYFKKQLRIATEMGNKKHQTSAYLSICDAYIDCNDTVLVAEGIAPTTRYPKALEALQKAADLNNFVHNYEY